MHIPPQEDWSPELLNELQRAVPVLESTSFDLSNATLHGGSSFLSGALGSDWDMSRNSETRAGGSVFHGAAASRGASRLAEGSFRWAAGCGWGTEAYRRPGEVLAADPLSDEAMALPMSTLTSGKRHTYPNRSTFQAHVCCVMDPLQVPHVVDSLRASPHFGSARHWPHAYRIISPFDGRTREGSDDGGDPGAGEKMLQLLIRMGLENLLLIISRWDSGPVERLSTELFKCVNEQCKALLRELQQAVRASFPPEELLGPTRAGVSAGTVGDASDDDLADLFGGSPYDDNYNESEEGSGYVVEYGMDDAGSSLPHVDPDLLGPRPPSELIWAARGLCALSPQQRRGLATRALGTDGSPLRRAREGLMPSSSKYGFRVCRCALAPRGQGRGCADRGCPQGGCWLLSEPPNGVPPRGAMASTLPMPHQPSRVPEPWKPPPWWTPLAGAGVEGAAPSVASSPRPGSLPGTPVLRLTPGRSPLQLGGCLLVAPCLPQVRSARGAGSPRGTATAASTAADIAAFSISERGMGRSMATPRRHAAGRAVVSCS